METGDNATARAVELLEDAEAAGDWKSVADLAARYVLRLYLGHHDEFVALVQKIAADVPSDYPALFVIHPAAGVAMRSSRGLDTAPLDSYSGVPGEEQATVALLKLIAARASGDIVTAVSFAKHLEALTGRGMGGNPLDPTGPLWFFHDHIGFTLLCAGDVAGALRNFVTARQYAETFGNLTYQRISLGHLALARAVSGSIGEADRALQLAMQIPMPSGQFEAVAIGTESVAAALISVECMSADAEMQVAALAEAETFATVWPFVFLARSRHLLATHRPEEALELARSTAAAHVVQPGTFAANELVASRVYAHLALADAAGAFELIESQVRPGVAIRIASLNASIYASDFAEAARMYRDISRETQLTPSERIHLQVLRVSMLTAQHAAVPRELAEQVANTATSRGSRRLISSLPAQAIDIVRSELAGESLTTLDNGTEGLRFLPARGMRPRLTPAEMRVLHALPSTASVAEVAQMLDLSVNTVKTQQRKLYRKLGVESRSEAVVAGAHFGFLDEGAAALLD